MSDPNLITQRQIQDLQDGHERLRKTDVSALYLPWSQRVLNPFPLASSGGVWGDMGMPWEINVIAFYCSVFVVGTNNGTNFWTVRLKDSVGTVISAFATSAIAAGVFVRFPPGIVAQPASTSPILFIDATATLSPGAIFIFPTVALLRTGN